MILRRLARRRETSRGVAAIELALSLVFLVPLMLGVLDYGYFFYIGAQAEDAARAGVRQAVRISAGGTCAATNTAVQTAGLMTATSTGTPPSETCTGGAAFCTMDQSPLRMGGASGPTTVTLNCLNGTTTPPATVEPTWEIIVTVDYASPLGRRMPWMPATPPAGSTTTVRYRATLRSN
jgi:Flp pilus assembly protein TadG